MKFHYYADTETLYIDLADRPGSEVQEVAPGVNLDCDAESRLVGIDIDHASQVVNLSLFEADSLPVTTSYVAQSKQLD